MVQMHITGLHIPGVTYCSAPGDGRVGDLPSLTEHWPGEAVPAEPVLCSKPFD